MQPRILHIGNKNIKTFFFNFVFFQQFVNKYLKVKCLLPGLHESLSLKCMNRFLFSIMKLLCTGISSTIDTFEKNKN